MIKRLLSFVFVIIFVFLLCTATVLCTNAKSNINEPGVTIDDRAGEIYLYNYDSDRVLILQTDQVAMAPSATAKMMAGLLVCQNYSSELDRSLTITEDMLKGIEGTSMQLKVGMAVTVRDLLYGTICGCNNDAAQALAISCAGSVREFVKEMNVLAQRLYMKNTVYKNPTGLDVDGATTTLADFARLAHRAAQNELYVSISSLASFEFTPQNADSRTVYNRNALVSQFSASGYINKYTKGLIAGSTDNGGYVLAAYAEKDESSYLCVIMGAQADGNTIYSYQAANAILDRAFRKYVPVRIAKQNDSFLSKSIALTVSDEDSFEALCVVPQDVYAFINEDVDIKEDIKYKAYLHDKDICAPLKAGQIVGGVDFYYNGTLIANAPLVVNEDIQANTILAFIHLVKDFFFSRIFLIGLVFSVLLVSLYLYYDAKSKRHKKVGRVAFSKFS